MIAGPGAAGQGTAVVRPRTHVEAVRADAVRAAQRRAARTGNTPSHLITDTISWALGDGDQAPFTGTHTVGGAGTVGLAAEIEACQTYLQATPWSEDADDSISRAQHILKILEWLTGADDRPPTYCRDTEPGDLIGGRGRIIRPDNEIRDQMSRASAKLATGQTSNALGADWHRGVIATLGWVTGDRPESPVLRRVLKGPPDGGAIAIEEDEAAEHSIPARARPGVPAEFADAVACTCRWLLGETTRVPVTSND